jgi:hypothetical protein
MLCSAHAKGLDRGFAAVRAILRWNGATCSPAASGTDRDLLKVAGTGSSDVWAVGGDVVH